MTSSTASLIISSFMSIISDSRSKSRMISWIFGMLICLFIVRMALVTPFMASAIACVDFIVCMRMLIAWSCARI